LMVKATGSHFLDAVGHRSHASEDPAPYLHSKDVARLRQTSQMSASQAGSYTLTFEKGLKTTHTILRRSRIMACDVRSLGNAVYVWNELLDFQWSLSRRFVHNLYPSWLLCTNNVHFYKHNRIAIRRRGRILGIRASSFPNHGPQRLSLSCVRRILRTCIGHPSRVALGFCTWSTYIDPRRDRRRSHLFSASRMRSKCIDGASRGRWDLHLTCALRTWSTCIDHSRHGACSFRILCTHIARNAHKVARHGRSPSRLVCGLRTKSRCIDRSRHGRSPSRLVSVPRTWHMYICPSNHGRNQAPGSSELDISRKCNQSTYDRR